MKSDPISNAERARIIHHLAGASTWEARRRGAAVRIVRFFAGSRNHIQYGVCLHRKWISGEADTVGDAVERCNRLIETGGRLAV